jgi:hypothetical protein
VTLLIRKRNLPQTHPCFFLWRRKECLARLGFSVISHSLESSLNLQPLKKALSYPRMRLDSRKVFLLPWIVLVLDFLPCPWILTRHSGLPVKVNHGEISSWKPKTASATTPQAAPLQVGSGQQKLLGCFREISVALTSWQPLLLVLDPDLPS